MGNQDKITNLHDNLLQKRDGKFFKLSDHKIPYKDCFVHKQRNQTRQGTIGMKIWGLLSQQIKFIYLCDDCYHRCVFLNDSGQLQFDPSRI